MGYSCTCDANDALAVIEHMFATDGNPNILTIHGSRYFFERGREQEDGAITGRLMLMLPGDYCKPYGSVRIEPDGTITSFPATTTDDREEAQNTLADMAARNPQLLRRWGQGII